VQQVAATDQKSDRSGYGRDSEVEDANEEKKERERRNTTHTKIEKT
jgi:hypothetical protein